MNDAQPRPFHIRIDRELTHPQVIALLEEHLAGMRAESPPECVFALDLDGLRRPEITFLTAWRRAPSDSPGDAEGELLAMGAIKELAPTTALGGGHGELTSPCAPAHATCARAPHKPFSPNCSTSRGSAAMRG
ncbi:hypothetical protein [Hydrogenophaga taeniospiralis]|uniref:hypothetical protein n=1 Tax=Hydrogenophaga taeniospiralis TaxID=65656 RepID=UPI0039AFE610